MTHTSDLTHRDDQGLEPVAASSLKEYRTPQLRDLGKLSELTQAGGPINPASDGNNSYAPVS